MNIDEIVKSESHKYKGEYNKDDYKAYKAEEKKQIYLLADEAANKVFESTEMLKQYLDVQARFSNYSINNALLIMSQMPEARVIKSLDEWKKLGAFAKPNCKWIKILEPGKKYLGSDNLVYAAFNTKKVLDISQTTLELRDNPKKIKPEDMLKAFLYKCPFNVKATDDLTSGKVAEYDADNDWIYIKRGADTTQMFNDLSYAFVSADLENTGTKDINNFLCSCSAYLICKSMNIDTNSFNLEIPSALKNIEVVDKKDFLRKVKNHMENNSLRINEYYKVKEQLSKDKER